MTVPSVTRVGHSHENVQHRASDDKPLLTLALQHKRGATGIVAAGGERPSGAPAASQSTRKIVVPPPLAAARCGARVSSATHGRPSSAPPRVTLLDCRVGDEGLNARQRESVTLSRGTRPRIAERLSRAGREEQIAQFVLTTMCGATKKGLSGDAASHTTHGHRSPLHGAAQKTGGERATATTTPCAVRESIRVRSRGAATDGRARSASPRTTQGFTAVVRPPGPVASEDAAATFSTNVSATVAENTQGSLHAKRCPMLSVPSVSSTSRKAAANQCGAHHDAQKPSLPSRCTHQGLGRNPEPQREDTEPAILRAELASNQEQRHVPEVERQPRDGVPLGVVPCAPQCARNNAPPVRSPERARHTAAQMPGADPVAPKQPAALINGTHCGDMSLCSAAPVSVPQARDPDAAAIHVTTRVSTRQHEHDAMPQHSARNVGAHPPQNGVTPVPSRYSPEQQRATSEKTANSGHKLCTEPDASDADGRTCAWITPSELRCAHVDESSTTALAHPAPLKGDGPRARSTAPVSTLVPRDTDTSLHDATSDADVGSCGGDEMPRGAPQGSGRGSPADASSPECTATRKKREVVDFWRLPVADELSQMVAATSQELVGWMVEREKVAIRRRSGMPWDEWSDDPILLTYRFCNVRREQDRVTRAVIDGLRPLNEAYDKKPSNDVARVMLVSIIVWRFIGSEAFVRAVGPIDPAIFAGGPDNAEEKRVVDTMVDLYVHKGECCFTDAYRPAHSLRNFERKYVGCAFNLRLLYQTCFREKHAVCELFQPVHKMFQMDRLVNSAKRLDEMLAALKRDRTFESVATILQDIPGMGKTCVWSAIGVGTRKKTFSKRVAGFSTKEVLQDLLLTPLAVYDSMLDAHEYCPVGPGALKGIMTLFEIPKNKSLYGADVDHLLRELYIAVKAAFPDKILDVQQRMIRMHEVQSALCEGSKYRMVVGLGNARHRHFAPRSASVEAVTFVNRLLHFTREYRRQHCFHVFGDVTTRAGMHQQARRSALSDAPDIRHKRLAVTHEKKTFTTKKRTSKKRQSRASTRPPAELPRTPHGHASSGSTVSAAGCHMPAPTGGVDPTNHGDTAPARSQSTRVASTGELGASPRVSPTPEVARGYPSRPTTLSEDASTAVIHHEVCASRKKSDGDDANAQSVRTVVPMAACKVKNDVASACDEHSDSTPERQEPLPNGPKRKPCGRRRFPSTDRCVVTKCAHVVHPIANRDAAEISRSTMGNARAPSTICATDSISSSAHVGVVTCDPCASPKWHGAIKRGATDECAA